MQYHRMALFDLNSELSSIDLNATPQNASLTVSSSTFNPRVSFDTFAYQSAVNPAYSTVFQHRFYADQGRKSRTFLCGTDESDYSAFALEYIIEELVDDGDTIVCVRVVDRESEMMRDFMSNQAEYRQAADKVKERVTKMLDDNNGPAVKIIIELIVGKIGETVNRMVR